MLASLNHPNIAVIHGFEEAHGIQALVMELVEGPTLADRIAQGPIPLDEALPIAKQIAEALEAAHEQGIIHRDLKPANIKVRPDGTVKVLDFGLAKVLGTPGGTDSVNAPTVTAVGTRAGVVLGTAAYMSPEQARGSAVDKRADIWAFGCVLYELLTGEVAFKGETVLATLGAVLTTEAPLQSLPPSIPSAIRQLLNRHYLRYSRDPILAKAEMTARSAKLGLWNHLNPVPPWEFRRPARIRPTMTSPRALLILHSATPPPSSSSTQPIAPSERRQSVCAQRRTSCARHVSRTWH